MTDRPSIWRRNIAVVRSLAKGFRALAQAGRDLVKAPADVLSEAKKTAVPKGMPEMADGRFPDHDERRKEREG